MHGEESGVHIARVASHAPFISVSNGMIAAATRAKEVLCLLDADWQLHSTPTPAVEKSDGGTLGDPASRLHHTRRWGVSACT